MAANSSLHSPVQSCYSPQMTFFTSVRLVLYILMIPLLVFVLVTGVQRWRRQTSSPHIDIFTYNVVVLDLLGISGTCFMFFGGTAVNPDIEYMGSGMFGISSTGHPMFHVLTCIERYLAVVHPVYYLQLRGPAGVRTRNIIIGCVWLISVGLMSLSMWLGVSFVTLSFVLLSVTCVAFCFCSVSVLCALIRPGPGEGCRTNRCSNQSKQRALHTMVIITGILSLRFTSSLVNSIVLTLSNPFGYIFCAVGFSSVWFLLPSNLVLPLLFLQRVGKLKVCGHKADNTA